MATGEMTPEKAAELARAELEPGVAAVRVLAEAQARLGEVLKEHAGAWREASKYWPPEKLKRWGFEAPLRPGPGRPKGAGRLRVQRLPDSELVSEGAALNGRADVGAGSE